MVVIQHLSEVGNSNLRQLVNVNLNSDSICNVKTIYPWSLRSLIGIIHIKSYHHNKDKHFIKQLSTFKVSPLSVLRWYLRG